MKLKTYAGDELSLRNQIRLIIVKLLKKPFSPKTVFVKKQ
jgi:hypothetical protein